MALVEITLRAGPGLPLASHFEYTLLLRRLLVYIMCKGDVIHKTGST